MDWHRLFGLILTDFFTGSPYVVELEKDLSVQQQLLDVLIIRKGEGQFSGRLPDGLDDLSLHNLLTFKSHHEALDGWALHELIGHYVSYRKLVSPAPNRLLPEADFRLYAVCARFPHNLAQEALWETQQPGVYRCRWGTAAIRVIVTRELPEAKHNAPMHLFAAEVNRVRYGQAHYKQRSEKTSTVLKQLLITYGGEGLAMPYTIDDFVKDFITEHFKDLSPEQRERALQPLPAEERLKGLPLDAILKALPPEQLEHLQQEIQTLRKGPKRRKR